MEFRKPDLDNMTWREIFELYDENFERIKAGVISNKATVNVEQFDGGSSEYELNTVLTESSNLVMFIGDTFLGDKVEEEQYVIEGNKIIFNEVLSDYYVLTVFIFDGDFVGDVQNFLNEIQELLQEARDIEDRINSKFLSVDDYQSSISTYVRSELYRIQENLEEFEDYMVGKQNIYSQELKQLNNEGKITKNEILEYKQEIEELLKTIESLISGGPGYTEEGEVAEARRDFISLATRLNHMPFTVSTRQELLDSDRWIIGDTVIVTEGEISLMYKIRKDRESDLDIELKNKLYAHRVKFSMEEEDYTEYEEIIKEMVQSYKTIADSIETYIPTIVEGYWYVWNGEEYINTYVKAEASETFMKTEDDVIYYKIGENGEWKTLFDFNSLVETDENIDSMLVEVFGEEEEYWVL